MAKIGKNVLKILNLIQDWSNEILTTITIGSRDDIHYQDPIYIKKDILKNVKVKVPSCRKEIHFHKNNFNNIPSNKRLRKWYNNKVCKELR